MSGPWAPGDPRWDDEAATVPLTRPAPRPLAPPAPPPTSRRAWALVVGALLVAGGGTALLVRGPGTATPADTRPADPRPSGEAPGRAPAPAIDGTDGPGHHFDVTSGVLHLDDGSRYRVGEPGDVLLEGDWDCDGRPTPALYRPATGEVFTFPRWPDGDVVTSSRAVPTGVLHGTPRVATAPPGCARVEVDPS